MKKTKKILVGSILIICFLLVLPSVSALKDSTVVKAKGNIIQEFQLIPENTQEIKITEIIKNVLNDNVDRLKHPILLKFVVFVYLSMAIRGVIWFVLADTDILGPGMYNIKHPFAHFRSNQLIVFSVIWQDIWLLISEIMGWNWDYLNFP